MEDCIVQIPSPTLTNVTIHNNRSNGSGGGIFCQGEQGDCDLYLKNVTITGNEAYNWGGGIYSQYSDVVIVNSLIADNKTSEYGGGGGICCVVNSTMALANVTVTRNRAYLGGGIQVEYDSNMHLENCILWGNEPDETFIATGAYVSANYCDIGEEAIGTGNINSNPLFADTLFYYLSEESPCIDTGNPDTLYYDIEDPDNSGFALYPAMGTLHNDMGTYGGHGNYEPVLSTDDPQISHSIAIHNYPNPFTSSTVIHYTLPQNIREAHIEIYNIKGQLVQTILSFPNPSLSGRNGMKTGLGTHEVIWDGKDDKGKKIGAGMYFIYMKTGENVNVRKIVKLNL